MHCAKKPQASMANVAAGGLSTTLMADRGFFNEISQAMAVVGKNHVSPANDYSSWISVCRTVNHWTSFHEMENRIFRTKFGNCIGIESPLLLDWRRGVNSDRLASLTHIHPSSKKNFEILFTHDERHISRATGLGPIYDGSQSEILWVEGISPTDIKIKKSEMEPKTVIYFVLEPDFTPYAISLLGKFVSEFKNIMFTSYQSSLESWPVVMLGEPTKSDAQLGNINMDKFMQFRETWRESQSLVIKEYSRWAKDHKIDDFFTCIDDRHEYDSIRSQLKTGQLYLRLISMVYSATKQLKQQPGNFKRVANKFGNEARMEYHRQVKTNCKVRKIHAKPTSHNLSVVTQEDVEISQNELYKETLFHMASEGSPWAQKHFAEDALSAVAKGSDVRNFLLPEKKAYDPKKPSFTFPKNIDRDYQSEINADLSGKCNINYSHQSTGGHPDAVARREHWYAITFLDWGLHKKTKQPDRDTLIKYGGDNVSNRTRDVNELKLVHCCQPILNAADPARVAKGNVNLLTNNKLKEPMQLALHNAKHTDLYQCHNKCQDCNITSTYLYLSNVVDMTPSEIADSMDSAQALAGRVIIPWNADTCFQLTKTGYSNATKQFFEVIEVDGVKKLKCYFGDGLEQDYIHDIANLRALYFSSIVRSNSGNLYSFTINRRMKGPDGQPEMIAIDVHPIVTNLAGETFEVSKTVINLSDDAYVPVLEFVKKNLFDGGVAGRIKGSYYIRVPVTIVNSVLAGLLAKDNMTWQDTLKTIFSRLVMSLAESYAGLLLTRPRFTADEIVALSISLFIRAFFQKNEIGSQIKQLTEGVKDHFRRRDGGFKNKLSYMWKWMAVKCSNKSKETSLNLIQSCDQDTLAKLNTHVSFNGTVSFEEISASELCYLAAMAAVGYQRIIYPKKDIVVVRDRHQYLGPKQHYKNTPMNFVSVVPSKVLVLQTDDEEIYLNDCQEEMMEMAKQIQISETIRGIKTMQLVEDSPVEESTTLPKAVTLAQSCDHSGLEFWDPKNKDNLCLFRCLLRYKGLKETTHNLSALVLDVQRYCDRKSDVVAKALANHQIPPLHETCSLLADMFKMSIRVCSLDLGTTQWGTHKETMHIQLLKTDELVFHALLVTKPELLKCAWNAQAELKPLGVNCVLDLERSESVNVTDLFTSRVGTDYEVTDIFSSNPTWLADSLYKNSQTNIRVLTKATNFRIDSAILDSKRFIDTCRLEGRRRDMVIAADTSTYNQTHLTYLDMGTMSLPHDEHLRHTAKLMLMTSNRKPLLAFRIFSAADYATIKVVNFLKHLFCDTRVYQFTESQRHVGGCYVVLSEPVYEDLASMIREVDGAASSTSYPRELLDQFLSNETQLGQMHAEKYGVGCRKVVIRPAQNQITEDSPTYRRVEARIFLDKFRPRQALEKVETKRAELECRKVYEENMVARLNTLFKHEAPAIVEQYYHLDAEVDYLRSHFMRSGRKLTNDRDKANVLVRATFDENDYLLAKPKDSIWVVRDNSRPFWTSEYHAMATFDNDTYLLTSRAAAPSTLPEHILRCRVDVSHNDAFVLADKYNLTVAMKTSGGAISILKKGGAFTVCMAEADYEYYTVGEKRESSLVNAEDWKDHTITFRTQSDHRPSFNINAQGVFVVLPPGYELHNNMQELRDVLSLRYSRHTRFSYNTEACMHSPHVLSQLTVKDGVNYFGLKIDSLRTNMRPMHMDYNDNQLLVNRMRDNLTFGRAVLDPDVTTDSLFRTIMNSLKEFAALTIIDREKLMHSLKKFKTLVLDEAQSRDHYAALAERNGFANQIGVISVQGEVLLKVDKMENIVTAFDGDESVDVSYCDVTKRFRVRPGVDQSTDVLMITSMCVNDSFPSIENLYTSIAHRLTPEDVRTVFDKIHKIITVFGAGKSTTLCKRVAETINSQVDLVIVASNENKRSITKELMVRGADEESCNRQVRTLASLLKLKLRAAKGDAAASKEMKILSSMTNVYWDEALMQHAGAVWAVLLSLPSPSKIILIGDPCQTVYRCDREDIGKPRFFELLAHGPWSDPSANAGALPLDVSEIVNVTQRCGPLAAMLASDIYKARLGKDFEIKSARSLDTPSDFKVLTTDQGLLEPSLRQDMAATKANGGRVIVVGVTSACTAQAREEVKQLASQTVIVIPKEDINTIKASQGATADLVIIFRSKMQHTKLLDNLDLILVAISRSKFKTIYVSKRVGYSDNLADYIESGMKQYLRDPTILKKYRANESDMTCDKLFDKILGPSRSVRVGAWNFREAVETNGLVTLWETTEPTDNGDTGKHLEVTSRVRKPTGLVSLRKLARKRSPREPRYIIREVDYRQNRKVFATIREAVFKTEMRDHYFIEFDKEDNDKDSAVDAVTDTLVPAVDSIEQIKTKREFARLTDERMELASSPDMSTLETIQEQIYDDFPHTEAKRMIDQIVHDSPVHRSAFFSGSVREIEAARKLDKSNLRPKLKTPLQRPNTGSDLETLYALNARNLGAPDLFDHKYTDNDLARKLFRGFTRAFYKDKRPRPYLINRATTRAWSRETGAVTEKTLKNFDFALVETHLNKYEVMLKRMSKPGLKQRKELIYESAQVITKCHGAMIHVFSPIIRHMTEWLINNLAANVMINCGVSNDELENFADLHILTDTVRNVLELDLSKYDKSQQMAVLLFECKLFEWFGLPQWIIDYWFKVHNHVILFNRNNGMKAKINLQRRTGDSGTYIFNTAVNMALTTLITDVSRCQMALFGGDDAWIAGVTTTFNAEDIYASMFNFEVKRFLEKDRLFCSRFLIKTTAGNVCVPHPIKALLKLGRKDIYSRDVLKEVWTSYKDNWKHLDKLEVQQQLQKSVKERDGLNIDASAVCSFLASLVKNYDKFDELFREPQESKHRTIQPKTEI